MSSGLRPRRRDLGQRLSGERLQGLAAEGHEPDPVGRAGQPAEVLEAPARRAHVAEDAGARRTVANALEGASPAAFLDPRRQAGVQPGGPRGVGVHVGGDLQALAPRRLDLPDGPLELRPVGLARRLQVVDLGGLGV